MITRHGETEENREGVFMGQLQGKLSKEGIEQAKKLALRLKDEKIDFIYSSDLKRAVDTAREIARFHKNTPLELNVLLRERHLGEYQGKRKIDFGWNPKDLRASLIEPKEGETKKQMFDRGKLFLDKILEKHKDDNVLVVGHNGINKTIVAAIIGKTHDELKEIEPQGNAEVSIFEIKGKEHKIIVQNCNKHLK